MTHRKRNRLTVTGGMIFVIGVEMLIPEASLVVLLGALATNLVWIWDI